MVKMELDFETVLDVALGGPEIGPLNLYVLHGLMKEVFEKFDLSQKQLIIEEEDPHFCDGYNFIKSKVDEKNKRCRTAGGGYSRERSKVSVIVSDYARSPIGQQQKAEEKKPSLLPTDIEDRLRYVESELKIVKNFPSVDELRTWAQEKTSPDTVVTDLWHFVSLNHRMGGAEEGIGKLTELVDKLIPELKKLGDEQSKIQGQIDDLYSQLKGLSDRSSRIDARIDNAGEVANERSQEIANELKNLEDKMNGYAKLMDLEDFVLTDTFVEAQENAKIIAKAIQDELATKAPLSMFDDMLDQGELKRLSELVDTLREQMENAASKDDLQHLDLYVKWPQLEDALTTRSNRPNSRTGTRQDSEFINRFNSGSQTISRPDSRLSSRPGSSRPTSSRPDSRLSGRSGSMHSANSRVSPPAKIYPSEACVQKLRDIGMLAERQAALMDALEITREQLALKANKSDLEGFLTQDDLKDLLNLLRNLREEVNGLQSWRALVDDEKVPALKAVLNELEKQMADMVNAMENMRNEENRKQKAIDTLFTYVDRLEENKLDKDDERLNQIPKNKHTVEFSIPSHENEVDGLRRESDGDSSRRGSEVNGISSEANKYKSGITRDELDDALDRLNKILLQLLDRFNDHEIDYKKKIAAILDDLDDKLDRSELQPLREYLENRYNTLSQQQQEHEQPRKQTSPRDSKKHKLPHNGISISHTLTQDIPPSYNPSKNTSMYTPTKGTPGQSRGSSAYNPSKGAMPYIHYDDVECEHPHYGEGGFYPQKKEAAAIRTQMKFNCLSCDRPLTMQTNSHLQTIRGRPLNAYELDQLRLLQKILKGNNPGKPTRACGGKHTSGHQTKRITARINSTTSLPAMVTNDPDELLIDGEVDIEGLDGRLYKGLISRKDLKNHSRSKSANAQLRTVSPRPISGKSVDFTSSLSSGLGTTHGSFDIQIEE